MNQFWYRHWYSDTCRTLQTKQDITLEHFVHMYLRYGLSYSSNTMIHEYWYKPNYRKHRYSPRPYVEGIFFRRHFFTNQTLSIEHTYMTRNEAAEFFPMRTWIMRFDRWLVISVQWYKPAKTKRYVGFRSGIAHGSSVGASRCPSSNRTKLLMLLITKSLKCYSKKYFF
jgi:hypothetical protein